MKNSKSGFSLVELMVVVAIIGILATIAIPNFQKFQAKSKQTNAKSELSAIYTAEKSFFAEYSNYNAALAHVGYVPDGVDLVTGLPNAGVLRIYTTGFATGQFVCDATTCPGFTPPTAATSTAALSYPHNVTGGAVQAMTGATLVNAGGVNTFTAAANGFPRTSSLVDGWTIDQNRVLLNASPGI